MSFTDKTIGEIVADDFRTAAIFKKHGIDFCCKGGRTISEACERKGVEEQVILEQIQALPQGGVVFSPNDWPTDLLAYYIERVHHSYVREKSVYLLQFLHKVCSVHGSHHPELFQINEHFTTCNEALLKHMQLQEADFFPSIKKIGMGQATAQEAAILRQMLPSIVPQNEVFAQHFEKIAELTSQYTPPAYACNTYRVTFAMLEEYEKELHQYIHLYNNILLPKLKVAQ